MRYLLLFLALSAVGCVSPNLHVEGGFAAPDLGGQRLFRDTNDLRHLHAGLGAVHIEETLGDWEYLAIDAGLGPMVISSHQGWVAGGEVIGRIRVKLFERFEPYLVATAGVGYAEGWAGSDVDYTYTTGLGVGALFRVTESLSIMADWRWLHHSNGMTFHSDAFRQTIGQKEATRNEGNQNGAIMFGIQWTF